MDLEKRITRLERSNRLYRITGTVLLIVLAGVVTLAMTAADTEDFRIYDADGNQRARLGMAGNNPGLFFFGTNGKRRLYLGLDGNDKPIVKFFNDEGRESSYVNIYGFGRGMATDAAEAPAELVCYGSKSDGSIYHRCPTPNSPRCQDIGPGFLHLMKLPDAKKKAIAPCPLCFPEEN